VRGCPRRRLLHTRLVSLVSSRLIRVANTRRTRRQLSILLDFPFPRDEACENFLLFLDKALSLSLSLTEFPIWKRMRFGRSPFSVLTFFAVPFDVSLESI